MKGMLTTNAGGAEGPGVVTALMSVAGGETRGGTEGPGAVTALTSIAGGDMGGGSSPPSYTEKRPYAGDKVWREALNSHDTLSYFLCSIIAQL